MKRLIVFLIRRRLGLKRYEYFQFVGQKTKSVYYFDKDRIIKMIPTNDGLCIYIEKLKGRYLLTDSNVSLNWLLNNGCKIRKVA